MVKGTRRKGSPTPIPPTTLAALMFIIGAGIIVVSWLTFFRTGEHDAGVIWLFTICGLIILGLGVGALSASRDYTEPLVDDY